jgi:hypothetical protein
MTLQINQNNNEYFVSLSKHYAIGEGPFENLPAITVIRASLTSNSSSTAPKLCMVSKHHDNHDSMTYP